ncbi:MAG: hypothetical protein IJ196_04765 [Prevotella sp.]|nr:hypothetical protein [Prevotella sp.]
MTQLFWNAYKRIEKEFLALAEVVHIDDDQLKVYSSKISDLLVRTAIECEALSKELYHANGGTKPSGKDLYFDTDCLGLLHDKWKIDQKKIFVTSPFLYLEKEEDRVLTPLHKSFKRGTSSSKWQIAYQAVKHDRANNLKKGTIDNLLQAMGALYILNIYYRDANYTPVADKDASNIDWSLGSELFAVKVCAEHDGASAHAIYEKKADYDECIYFVKHTDKTGKAVLDLFSKFQKQVNDEVVNGTQQSVEAKLKSGELNVASPVFQDEVKAIAEEQQKNAFQRVGRQQGREIANALQGLKFEALLNKQQY